MKLPYAQYAKAKDFTCLGQWTLLTGPEHFYKRDALARMKAEVMARGDATWEVLEGPEATVRELAQRSQTLGLFGGARGLVILQPERMDKEQQEELAWRLAPKSEKDKARVFPPLSPEIAIIMITGESGDRRGKTVKAALVKAIESRGLVVDCPEMKGPEATAWALARAKELGKKLDPAAASLLTGQRIGSGLGQLASELEKLAVYVGDAKTITAADVEAVTPQLLEESVFRLTDLMATQQTALAVATLRTLVVDQRQEPIFLLSLLAGAIREIWQVKLLVERGWRKGVEMDEETKAMLPQDERRNALRAFGGKKAFLADKRTAQAKAFSWSRLARAMQALAACDQAMKGMGEKFEDPQVAMELLVVQLCSDVGVMGIR
jgi:DNA polymerase III delta subunit